MSNQRYEELLISIADTIKDYREGEIPAPDRDHVDKWVSQFDQFDLSYKDLILEGMNSVLQKNYIKRSEIRDLIKSMLDSEEIFGKDLAATLPTVQFLDVQERGNSQKDLLALLDEILEIEYNLKRTINPTSPSMYIYLDEALFSGNRAIQDIEKNLSILQDGSILHFVFFSIYNAGKFYVANRLNLKLLPKKIKTYYWRSIEFSNVYNGAAHKIDTLWPLQYSDASIDNYVKELEKQAEERTNGKYPPRLFRPANITIPLSGFSSVKHRVIIEEAFLRAGTYIVSLPVSPGQTKTMRPLGYELFESFGFGSMFITYRNCPNNCPLALWWGEPTKSETETLGKWYPLFPRKVNSSGFKPFAYTKL